MRWLSLFVKGALIGIGGILPGVSGGVLCVAFGVYQPMMELLAHPVSMFPKHYKLVIPIILGAGAGFLGLSNVIAMLLERESRIVICGFVGLIVGMIPSLYRDAGKKGRDMPCWYALGISTCLLLTMFMMLQFGDGVNITPNMGWFLFSGLIWGLSIIVPGMSSSSLLLFLGLYGPMSEGIASLNMQVVIPFVVGIVLTVLALARGVKHLFDSHYGITFHCVLGFVIASTVPLIPTGFDSPRQLFMCLLVAVVGFVSVRILEGWGNGIAPQ